MNLRNWFDLTFTHRAEQEALEWAGSVYTFGEIDARSNRMARALAARGLTKGDRLCVYLANSIEMIDLYLACIKTGVIFVPINILYRDREMSHILSDAEPKLLVTAAEIPALLAEAALQSGEKLPEAAIDGEDTAALVYTSGTTGVSKGAMLTHNNFAVNGASLIQAWKITPADRLLLAPPLFHVHALGNGLHCWLMAACRMRLLERFDHTTAVAQFLDFQPTLFFGVPAMYVRLLDTPPLQAFEIGQRMRLFVSGSAPLPAQILEEFRALFGHTILERYGMTETLMNMSNPYEGERRPGSVGLPLPGVIVKIVGPDGNPVAEGETGELWLKGPNVFPGYWKREEATTDCICGWLVQDRRHRVALGGRLHHAQRPQERPHYFRRLQHLSEGDRRIPDGATGSGRSRGGGGSRSRAWRDPGGVCGLEERQRRSRPARNALPRETGVFQNPAAI